MTSTDELDHIRERVAEADSRLLDLIRSPYTQMSPWAITRACVYLNHPTRKPEDPPSARCICGKPHMVMDGEVVTLLGYPIGRSTGATSIDTDRLSKVLDEVATNGVRWLGDWEPDA